MLTGTWFSVLHFDYINHLEKSLTLHFVLAIILMLIGTTYYLFRY